MAIPGSVYYLIIMYCFFPRKFHFTLHLATEIDKINVLEKMYLFHFFVQKIDSLLTNGHVLEFYLFFFHSVSFLLLIFQKLQKL